MPKVAAVLGLVATFAMSGTMARAQGPLTSEQTASLDRAVTLWLGPRPAIGSAGGTGYTITADGDGFRFAKPSDPSADWTGSLMTGGGTTATLRPLDGGRWRFDDVRVDSPVAMTLPPGGDGSLKHMSFDFLGQSGMAVIDPTLATPSTSEFAADQVAMQIDTDKTAATVRTGRFATRGIWRPAGEGRVDQTQSTTLEKLGVQVSGRTKVSLMARSAQVESGTGGLSIDRQAAFGRILRDLVIQLRAARPSANDQADTEPPGLSEMTPEQRRTLRALLQTTRDLATAFDLSGALDDLEVSGGGYSARLRRVAFAEGIAAPGDRAELHLRIALEGLSSPDIPPGVLREFTPRKIVLAPRISGVPLDRLLGLIDRSLDDGKPIDLGPAIATDLLADGPISIGIDELAVDLGPATVQATGAVQVAGTDPSDLAGLATIEATGLNALIKRAGADPLLKQAAPALIFLRGVGEEKAGKTVWRIAYANQKLTVNGTDMSEMMK